MGVVSYSPSSLFNVQSLESGERNIWKMISACLMVNNLGWFWYQKTVEE